MHGQNTASINQLHLQGPKNSFNPKRLPVSHKSDRHSLEHQPNSHNTYTDFTYHQLNFTWWHKCPCTTVSFSLVGTHMSAQCSWEEGLWLLESSVQMEPLIVQFTFVSSQKIRGCEDEEMPRVLLSAGHVGACLGALSTGSRLTVPHGV